MKEIAVCIVDDNRDLRNALEEIIDMSDGFKCVGTIGTAQEAIAQIPVLKPDVVLMDINLGSEETGIDCVRALKRKVPSTDFMMCTVYEENEKILVDYILEEGIQTFITGVDYKGFKDIKEYNLIEIM